MYRPSLTDYIKVSAICDRSTKAQSVALTYCFFAFAIYCVSQNVGSSIDTPIISRQASIIYMGVTYRCIGVSYGLGTGKERSFLCQSPKALEGGGNI
jgi:hypothetical protein